MLKIFFLTAIVLICTTESARILGVVPTASYSHQIAFKKIWQELSKKGHDVTVITTLPSNDKSLVNLTEIDISFVGKLINEKYKAEETITALENGVFYTMEFLINVILGTSKEILESGKIRDVMNKKSGPFDVILVEVLYSEYFALGEIYDCPVIGILSMDGTQIIHDELGNPTHPAVHPDITLPFSSNLSFKERLISTIWTYLSKLFRSMKTIPRKQELMQKYFPNVTVNYRDIMKKMDMLFINVHPVLQGVRPLGPSTITIGGTTNIEEEKPLPQDIKSFIESADKGVVYFSLGGNVKSKNLAPELTKKLLDTFEKLPYKVLWKFETTKDDLPKNVRIINWAPQQDILRHPNVKLFITQGGLQSLQESIMAEKPMIAFPFFGDQAHNARIIKDKGMGRYFNYKYLDQEEFEATIHEIIENKQYKSAVQRIKKLILDEPMPAIEKAIWWTEYVIRNKGAKHLKNPIVDLPIAQYYQIDVFCALLLILTTVLSLLYCFVRFLNTYIVKKIKSKNKTE